jgi:hypothetical protein
MGEALFDRQDLQRLYPLRTFRERSRAHAWAKPCLAARTYDACGALAFRERPRTHAWAKPCLAGRPTMLVRTQSCEQNTSRSRPSGMELPDYPVVVLTPRRRTRMGPHFTIPPGLFPDSYLVTLPVVSFPGFVPRYASRRPFSRIRTSFCFPQDLLFSRRRPRPQLARRRGGWLFLARRRRWRSGCTPPADRRICDSRSDS